MVRKVEMVGRMKILLLFLALADPQPVTCYYWPPNAERGAEVGVYIHEDGRAPKAWAHGALRSILEGPQDEHTLRLYGALQIMASKKLAKLVDKGEP